MDGLIETHRSFVNTWEIDENRHMNVQFYMKRFDEAARFFSAFSGHPIGGPLPASRHIRYHTELQAADMTVIRSGRIARGAHAGRIVHVMAESSSGRLCATAIDTPSGDIGDASDGVLTELPETAAPRSLAHGPEPLLGKAAVIEAGGLVAHRRIVTPAECAADGSMLAQHYVGMASDAAPHVWNKESFGSGWLTKNGYGRVGVEMKATFAAPARVGDAIELVSSTAALGSRTIRLHHEITRLSDGMALAAIDVTALVINLETRKAISAAEFAAIRSGTGA